MSAARSAEHIASGLLVGAEHELLPEERAPITASDLEAGVVYGCRRIECLACRRPVKNRPGVMWVQRPDPHGLELAYDADDFSAFTGTTKFSDKYRVYACRCDFTQVRGRLTLEDAFRDQELQWVCRDGGGG